MKAVRIHEHGGIDVLKYESVSTPKVQSGEVLVRIKASAMNHLDLWVRRGIPGVPLPMIMGSDGAGEIVETDPNVSQFKTGDAVCIQPLVFCNRCRFCSRGQENYCNQWGIFCLYKHGTQC